MADLTFFEFLHQLFFRDAAEQWAALSPQKRERLRPDVGKEKPPELPAEGSGGAPPPGPDVEPHLDCRGKI